MVEAKRGTSKKDPRNPNAIMHTIISGIANDETMRERISTLLSNITVGSLHHALSQANREVLDRIAHDYLTAENNIPSLHLLDKVETRKLVEAMYGRAIPRQPDGLLVRTLTDGKSAGIFGVIRISPSLDSLNIHMIAGSEEAFLTEFKDKLDTLTPEERDKSSAVLSGVFDRELNLAPQTFTPVVRYVTLQDARINPTISSNDVIHLPLQRQHLKKWVDQLATGAASSVDFRRKRK